LLELSQSDSCSFNSDQLAFHAKIAKSLHPPPDLSPRQSYTRDITLEDIEEVKRHIKAHGLETAMGVDGFSYDDCLSIPNEKLLEFFLYCLKNQDMPRFWLAFSRRIKTPRILKLPSNCAGMLHAQNAHTHY
jgi:hypothetical protein